MVRNFAVRLGAWRTDFVVAALLLGAPAGEFAAPCQRVVETRGMLGQTGQVQYTVLEPQCFVFVRSLVGLDPLALYAHAS